MLREWNLGRIDAAYQRIDQPLMETSETQRRECASPPDKKGPASVLSTLRAFHPRGDRPPRGRRTAETDACHAKVNAPLGAPVNDRAATVKRGCQGHCRRVLGDRSIDFPNFLVRRDTMLLVAISRLAWGVTLSRGIVLESIRGRGFFSRRMKRR